MNMTSERNAAEVAEKAAVRIEEIYRTALRIEDAVKRLAGEGTGVAGALERLSLTLTEVRNLQYETAGTLNVVSADVKKLLADRSNSFIDRLGPDGSR
jgi:hypothetical protein